jgi:CubicO group peptidase (beta-lactamase class C family)
MSRRLSRALPAVALAALLAAPAAAQRRAAPVLDRSFDALVDSLLADWKVPGLGIAVVKGDQVILSRGYGVKDLETRAPVTAATKFAIGSVTKSFVVTGLAVQVKQGKVAWDSTVRAYLPDFQLHDPVATERMTVRDLLTHRSGLPRHDLLWYGSPFSREEIYRRMRHLQPSRDFRSTWQYQNLMYMTAGLLSGRLNGSSWEDVVRALVFQPLGMATADFSVTDLQRSADFSYGHAAGRNEPARRMPFRNIDAIGPAGSINASVAEMANYLRLQMAGGRWNGQELFTARDAAQMHSPQMVMAAPPPGPNADRELGHQQYGMGFFVTTYRGRKMVNHGGNIDGFSAEVNWLPDDSVGVVVLTNLNGTPVRDFLPRYVYDRLLGLGRIDWSGRFKVRQARQWARQDSLEAVAKARQKPGTRPSHALADYAGTYRHPGYAPVTITHTGGALRLAFNSFDLGMAHFHFDVFETEAAENRPIRWKVQFHMNPDGDIVSLSVPVEGALPPLEFRRDPPPQP